jgi:small subunit ribosomal protein S13
MARIAGVDLPKNKRIEIGLTYIYGIGRSVARRICEDTGVDVNTKTDILSEDDLQKLRRCIDQNFKVEGDLRREITLNIKRYVDLGAYRGVRHRKNLPVHGQRTHTNARTRKGPRRTVAGKKQAPPKG